jgi:glycosyltransferase involved in cell wall biosynthesis
MTERVTIGMPVYRGKLFIEESLNSVLDQTYEDYDVIISVDGPDPECEEICSKFLVDPRIRMVVQPQRLGWRANMNWLMAQVQTEFWHLQEQDDVIDPNFLEVLVNYARSKPTVATVYTDIRVFGNMDFPIVQQSVLGSAFIRQMTLLYEHLSAVALSGLSRVEALRTCGGIPGNEMEDFFAETAWMAGMARWGELHRLPGELYHKRIHGRNTVTTWYEWSRDKRLLAWQIHCLSMFEQAVQIEADVKARRLLWLTAAERLVSPRTASKIIADISELTSSERVEALDGFLNRSRASATLNVPALLDADWEQIVKWTKVFYSFPEEALSAVEV